MITVLHSSHAVADLEEGCDFLMILRNGLLECAGATSELLGPGRTLAGFVLAVLRGTAADGCAGNGAEPAADGDGIDGTDREEEDR